MHDVKGDMSLAGEVRAHLASIGYEVEELADAPGVIGVKVKGQCNAVAYIEPLKDRRAIINLMAGWCRRVVG